MAPDVHELTHSTRCAPESLPISSYKAFTLGPVVIQPDFKESTTSLMTLSSMYGGEKGIFISLLFCFFVQNKATHLLAFIDYKHIVKEEPVLSAAKLSTSHETL